METKEKTIYQRLFEAKKEIGKISKDSTNPFYKSKYFDINSLLEHVEPVLFKYGLFVMQPITDNEVRTLILTSDHKSDEAVSSSIKLPNIDDPQKLGSAITYYRRYTLQSLLALQAEDDDGNSAKPTKQTKQPDDDKRQWLNPGTEKWTEAIKWLSDGGKIETIEANYKLSKANRELLISNAI